jgi:BCD family chlorophyll transporter-like MFS transporter
MTSKPLGWLGIVRLGLVQSALGAVTALAITTLNRVMRVEEAMPAVLPAAFVAWHYAIQLSRPRWGYGSDMGARRTPWIIGGMGVLVLGAILATDATLMVHGSLVGGLLLGLVAYTMIGAGVGAAGTSLLALLATQVAPDRRPAAAAITWIMMIVGIVISAIVTGALLKPFSPERLAMIASCLAGVAFLLTLLAVWGAERNRTVEAAAPSAATKPAFRQVLAEVWADPLARRFTIFVFLSMMAYSAQELVLEPFAGLVFHMSPGGSAQLTGAEKGGVLLGMILVGVLGSRFGDKKSAWMRRWTVAGCVGSAVALMGLAAASLAGPGFPLAPVVFVLGFANGVFAVSAIGSMMGLAGAGRAGREGVNMGVWGAAQAGGFAIGGLIGATGSDVMVGVLHQSGPAFLVVFVGEALLFLLSAVLAVRLGATPIAIKELSPSTQLSGAH